MRINIAVSTYNITFVKDQRVIVKVANNEWYCGVVTTVKRNGGLEVDFNDGDYVELPNSDNVRLVNFKGRKGSYSDVEVTVLISRQARKRTTAMVSTEEPSSDSIARWDGGLPALTIKISTVS